MFYKNKTVRGKEATGARGKDYLDILDDGLAHRALKT